MARKVKEEVLEESPASIDPYKILEIDEKATADQVKSAYRKQALKHHPDKALPEDKENAHQKFQEIAFAYAILSDDRRRKRYDTTGNSSESVAIEDDDFNWTDFFREQYTTMVSGDALEKIKKEYQNSDEERRDLLEAYERHQGDMDAVYEDVLCSNVLEDDERFREIIDNAIQSKEVQSHRKYTKESAAHKQKRITKARKEESEAMELADELGVTEKLFGADKTGKKKKPAKDSEASLAALIQQRQKGRAENFLDELEAKYGGDKKKKKRAMDEPAEEAFQRNRNLGAKKQRAGKT